jgi:hypothetical protein
MKIRPALFAIASIFIGVVQVHAGRWISRDPIQEGSGFVQRDMDLTEAGNLYAFVANDPIDKFDPFGLKTEVSTNFDPDQGLNASWRWGDKGESSLQAWTDASGKVECDVGLLERLGNSLFNSKCCVSCRVSVRQQITRNLQASGAIDWPHSYGHEQRHISSLLSEVRKMVHDLENEEGCSDSNTGGDAKAKELASRYQRILDEKMAAEAAHQNPSSPKARQGYNPLNDPGLPFR